MFTKARKKTKAANVSGKAYEAMASVVWAYDKRASTMQYPFIFLLSSGLHVFDSGVGFKG